MVNKTFQKRVYSYRKEFAPTGEARLRDYTKNVLRLRDFLKYAFARLFPENMPTYVRPLPGSANGLDNTNEMEGHFTQQKL